MTKLVYIDEANPSCPIRNILSRLSDKWSLVVLYTLSKNNSPMRFNALLRENPDISQKVLTSTLRTLTADGLIARTVYPEVPPRVEYALTERGNTLLPHVNALIEWALDNMTAILKDRRQSISEKQEG